MNASEFVATFGDVYEHSPWAASRAYGAVQQPLLHADVQARLKHAVDVATQDEQLALLRAHPDLAGRAALAGELTAASTSEQAVAGLDTLTPDEFSAFEIHNGQYTAKFGFPFIMAVKGATKYQILEGFTARLPNSVETEFATALEQVHRIAGFRLADWFLENAE